MWIALMENATTSSTFLNLELAGNYINASSENPLSLA